VRLLVATFFYAFAEEIEMCNGTLRMVAKQNLAIPSWIETLTIK